MIQRKIKIIALVGIVVLVCVYFVFIVFDKEKSTDQLPGVSKEEGVIPKNNIEYKNSVQNFILQYPKHLVINDFDEGEGTHTITFKSKDDEESFQIFFTPYYGDTITRSRMLKDIPSGSFTDPIEIIFGDNIRGLVFFSSGEVGDMREVWFIHNGYLFEVTTYKELDIWLAEIMKTWKFF